MWKEGASHTTHLLMKGSTARLLTGIMGTWLSPESQYVKSFLWAYLHTPRMSQNKNGMWLRDDNNETDDRYYLLDDT